MPYVFILTLPPYPSGEVGGYMLGGPGDFQRINAGGINMARREKGSYRVIELHMSEEAYNQWQEENGIGSITSNETVEHFLSKNNEALELKKKKEEQSSRLTEEMLKTFLASLTPNVTKGYAWNSAATLLKKRYFKYLYELDVLSPIDLNALKFQLKKITESQDRSILFIEDILQDIESGGKGHKALLKEEPDLIIERLKTTTEQSASTAPQHLPKQVKIGSLLSAWERSTVQSGPQVSDKALNPEGILNTQGRENKEDRELNTDEQNALRQLQAKGLTKPMLVNLNTVGEFSSYHNNALTKLMADGFTLIAALTAIDGSSVDQAEGISNGLTREDVIALKTRWEIRALVELKIQGLTAKILRARNSGGHSFDEEHFEILKLLAARLPIHEAVEKLDNLSPMEAKALYEALRNDLRSHLVPDFPNESKDYI